jgi:hypothetical protein
MPESGIIQDLRDIQGEFAQLTELEEMEHTYAEKLIDSFRLMQTAADMALPLNKNLVEVRYQNVEAAFLASEAVVVVKHTDGRTISVPLSKFKSGEILSILQEATPPLKKVIAEKRKEIGDRVELMEKILKELKKASSNLKQRKEEIEPMEEDLVSSSLAGQ